MLGAFDKWSSSLAFYYCKSGWIITLIRSFVLWIFLLWVFV